MLNEIAEEDPWATWSENNNPSTRNRVSAVDKNEEEKIWASWASVNQKIIVQGKEMNDEHLDTKDLQKLIDSLCSS